MKHTQIMIIFVVAILGAVFAQDNTMTVTVSGNTTTSPSFTGITDITTGNGTNMTTPDPLTTMHASTTVEPTTTADFSKSTAAPPLINTTTSSSTQAPTPTPPAVSNGTTVSPLPSTTTEATTAASVPCVPSGFDGASFIGGIVLALGVIVILVIIVKCYNHHSRKNELHYSQF